MSQKDKSFETRLSTVCHDAMRTDAQFNDPDLVGRWERRLDSIKSGRVTDENTVNWLRCFADYWQPKDREYAKYIHQLIGDLP